MEQINYPFFTGAIETFIEFTPHNLFLAGIVDKETSDKIDEYLQRETKRIKKLAADCQLNLKTRIY